MGAAAWLRLLIRHEFAIDRTHAGVAAIATVMSVRNSAMALLQSAVRLIRPGPPLPPNPIIILGHWRCGTTLIHELLAADPRHTAPTTYECLAPSHFRVTGPVAMRLLARWLPAIHRPMDRMPIAWQSPQEDDLAMLALGCPSAYDRIAFPRQGGRRPIDAAVPSDARWRRALSVWLRDVLARRPGRPVLKSPLHMARIPALLEVFPGAVFVHIVRDPYVVFPSTVHMWASMQREHGLQEAGGDPDAFVLDTFERLHARFEQHRPLIPDDRLVQVRYEDLARQPRRTLAAIYQRLGLGPFEPARARVDSYLETARGHETNQYPLASALETRITERWRAIIERHGYAVRHGAARELHAG